MPMRVVGKEIVGYIWMCPKIGVPQNRLFIMENPIGMDDLGVPLFLETPILELPPTQDAIVTTRTMNHF